jgi:DNA-binding response OmpR family regulator
LDVTGDPGMLDTSDRRKRILVIEDNGAVQALIEEILDDAGYRVYTSDHLLDPVDVQQLRPDLILLDVVIAGKPRGLDYLRLLRSQRWTAQIPVIVCSGEARALNALSPSERAMATAIVLKPFDLLDFLDTVATAIRHTENAPSDAAKEENRRKLGFGIPHWSLHPNRRKPARRRRVVPNGSAMRGWALRNARGWHA